MNRRWGTSWQRTPLHYLHRSSANQAPTVPQACQSDVVTIEPWMHGDFVRCVCFDWVVRCAHPDFPEMLR